MGKEVKTFYNNKLWSRIEIKINIWKHHVHWGSEIQPLEIQKQLNSGLFEGPTSNSQAFEMATAIVSIRWKLDHSKALNITDFKWQIENGSIFQMVRFLDYKFYLKSRPFAIKHLTTIQNAYMFQFQISSAFSRTYERNEFFVFCLFLIVLYTSQTPSQKSGLK